LVLKNLLPFKKNKKTQRTADTTMTARLNNDNGLQGRWTEGLLLTRVWQKWRFSAPQTHLWLIKVRFSASTFVVKIATFAKPPTVSGQCKKPTRKMAHLIFPDTRATATNLFYTQRVNVCWNTLWKPGKHAHFPAVLGL